MKIGIDISQTAYPGTGVANYTKNLVFNLLRIDKKNQYLLFFSSLRRKCPIAVGDFPNARLKIFKLPPMLLDFLWNRLHIFPIEWLIGDIDVFVTSDWVEPPAQKSKKVTILYDLIIYKHPQETARKIVETQKRKLNWVKKESTAIICISKATKKDTIEILGISSKKLRVVYPGGIAQ